MTTGVSFYIVPTVFSILMAWSLKKFIKKRHPLAKLLISFFLAFLAIEIYLFSHAFLNQIHYLTTIKLYAYGNLFAAFVITFINLFALWAFSNFKKEL